MAQNKPLGELKLAYRLPEAGGDLPHRFAHRVEKGWRSPSHASGWQPWSTCGQGFHGGLGLSTTGVSCDDLDLYLDLGLLGQPGLGGRRFLVARQCDRVSAFKIDK
ncbi:hypothetical protein EHI44_02625 [Rhizobium leguminosarum]|uniref:hypothetical protein n=1 Tax=Rhizobium leguminosarum TaxID=384 RepID=UPI000FED7896|nr:hypothetical protein [Rhizobium leguminosarum]RWY90449.1 hypothetical protein EHI44_02625 [Rhizobium leguminosarum]